LFKILYEFMVQIKFFEASSLGNLEVVGSTNFLERLDKKNIINISMATSEQEMLDAFRLSLMFKLTEEEPDTELYTTVD
jgi:hypothetical protein